jgi:thymidylate synthase ThyX
MTHSVRVISYSQNEYGERLASLQLRYPRMVHADFMTHRMFSRNASSSRAIPVARMIQDVIDDPAMPSQWGKNQKGMQARELLSEEDAERAKWAWLDARDAAVIWARTLNDIGAHKQIINRILEPFGHISVIVTSSNWANFLALRDHPDADPTIQVLAAMIRAELNATTPDQLKDGEWHLPYILPEDRENHTIAELIMMSVARCARVSYLTHDNQKPSPEQDLKLYDALVGSQPLHASPAEHQAKADALGRHEAQWGNFKGFQQYRKTLHNECVDRYGCGGIQ